MLLRTVALIAALLIISANAIAAGERIDLSRGDTTGQLSHVSIQIEVGGHNLVRLEQSDATEKSATAEQTQPISVTGKLQYDEKRLASDSTSSGAALAVRYYTEAEAAIKVGETGKAPRLTDDRRLIVLEKGEQRPLAFCPDGPLSREQFDLIDAVGDSFNADALLPKQPVAEGESWKCDANVVASL